MIYASSFSIGNALINYNGVGDRNDPNSYGLSIGPSSGYIGDFKIAQSNGRRIGDSTFQFGVIKPEFSQNKDVGYIYFPNLAFADITEFNPIFWEEYGVSTLIDQYARIFAAILETKVVTGSGEIKRFSEMDSLIIDNASNRGGEDDLMAAFATFFGNNRPSLSVVVSSSGTGFSASNIITEKLLPSSDIIKLNFWTSSTDLQCDKYQKKYPNAAFKGEKVIFLSSTSAFSAGDVSPHYFRNTRDNENSFGNLGKSVISDKKVSSILIGNIDGRLQGRADNLPNLVSFSRTSVFSFIPSVMGITAPLISYRVVGEDQYTLYNTYTGEPITSQLPEIKIDGINNEGPMNVWFEDDGGFFQAFGFSSVYLRGKNPRYDRFKIISEKPIPYNLLTYHYPFIEDAIIAATNNI
jgi:hypothetical protein